MSTRRRSGLNPSRQFGGIGNNAKFLAVPLHHAKGIELEIPREKVYRSTKQRLAWVVHYLKARFKHKERPRAVMLSSFFEPSSVIFDVGAHFGYLSKEFCKVHHKTCSVHAFEPVQYTRSILTKVAGHYPNLRIVDAALSDQSGATEISIPVKGSGKLGIGLSHFGAESRYDYILEPIRTITMDEYVSEAGLKRLDFIKCDVEGAELLVFKGAGQTLARYKPTIYCELSRSYTTRLGYDPEEVFTYLESLSYRGYGLSDEGNQHALNQYSPDVLDYLFIAE